MTLVSWKLKVSPYVPLFFLIQKTRWMIRTHKEFFRWEHHRYLMDWTRARSTTHISSPHLDSKQLAETKIFGQFVDARQKFWPGVASVELKSANYVCSPWASARPKTGLAVAFFWDQNYKQFWILGFFLESWNCGSAINPILFPYFLILWPNQKWDVFLTAVAQPRLVKLWIHWQDLLGLFLTTCSANFPYSQ